jgi:8-oxo-dGTP pyrophosphatase MutT (NUDIX family)
MLPFEILAFGVFEPARLRTRYEPVERPSTAALEELIAVEWERQVALAEQSRPKRLLFNGGLLRYVRHEVLAGMAAGGKRGQAPRGMPFSVAPVAPGSEPAPFCHGLMAGGGEAFELTVGPTCYRDFVGTNLFNHHRLDEFGWERFANPIGTTATLVSSDGLICYGRRSGRVAYHAGHVHTFGGALEEQDRTADGRVDPFASLRRELREELGLRTDDLTDLCCVGLIRDKEICQPELLFEARLTMTADVLRKRWEVAEAREEHDDLVALPDDADAIVPFIRDCGLIAPVAIGTLFLHGRRAWGEAWFHRNAASV